MRSFSCDLQDSLNINATYNFYFLYELLTSLSHFNLFSNPLFTGGLRNEVSELANEFNFVLCIIMHCFLFICVLRAIKQKNSSVSV